MINVFCEDLTKLHMFKKYFIDEIIKEHQFYLYHSNVRFNLFDESSDEIKNERRNKIEKILKRFVEEYMTEEKFSKMFFELKVFINGVIGKKEEDSGNDDREEVSVGNELINKKRCRDVKDEIKKDNKKSIKMETGDGENILDEVRISANNVKRNGKVNVDNKNIACDKTKVKLTRKNHKVKEEIEDNSKNKKRINNVNNSGESVLKNKIIKISEISITRASPRLSKNSPSKSSSSNDSPFKPRNEQNNVTNKPKSKSPSSSPSKISNITPRKMPTQPAPKDPSNKSPKSKESTPDFNEIKYLPLNSSKTRHQAESLPISPSHLNITPMKPKSKSPHKSSATNCIIT